MCCSQGTDRGKQSPFLWTSELLKNVITPSVSINLHQNHHHSALSVGFLQTMILFHAFSICSSLCSQDPPWKIREFLEVISWNVIFLE